MRSVDSEQDSIECWSNGDFFDGSIGSGTAEGTQKHARLLEQEHVQDEDFSIKKEKNSANVGEKPIIASVLQCCLNCKIGIQQDHGSHTTRR